MPTTTIDFEGFAAGTVIDDELSAFGITVFGDRNGSNPSVNDAMIFDADDGPPATGGDDDLLGGDGNVLIVSEDNDSGDPDDAAQGGTLTFEFDEPRDLLSIDIVDAFEGGFIITAFDGGGIQIGQVSNPGGGADAQVETVLLNFIGVSELVVEFVESGAVDNLIIDEPLEFEKDISNIVAYLDCDGDLCKIKFDDFEDGVREVTEAQVVAALDEAGFGDCDLLGITVKAGNNQNPEGRGPSVFGPGEGGEFFDFDTSDSFVTGTDDKAKVELDANDFDVFFV